jgi:hypothetical protein
MASVGGRFHPFQGTTRNKGGDLARPSVVHPDEPGTRHGIQIRRDRHDRFAVLPNPAEHFEVGGGVLAKDRQRIDAWL